MSVSATEKARRENERLISRLEKSYDKPSEYMRRFARDMQDIEKLLQRKAIDAAHASYLRTEAHRAYEQGREKSREPYLQGIIEEKGERFTKKWWPRLVVLFILVTVYFFYIMLDFLS